MDGLSTAIDQMAAAGEGRKTAELVAAGSQRELSFAQYRLDTENEQAKATLADEVKKEIDQKVKDALEQFKRTGDKPLDVSNFMDNAENKSLTLAPGNESGIIREDGKSLGTGAAVTIPGMGNKPYRALASAGAGTDVGYSDEYRNLQAPEESMSSSGEGDSGLELGKDGDVEVYWEDIQPTPAQTPSSTQMPSSTPMPTLSAPKYTINLALKGGFVNNRNVYPGVTERTLMPLDYLMQAQAVMINEEYPYAADQMISGNEKDKRTECVGMIRLPGSSWFASADSKHPNMFTTVGGTYRNSTHKGDFSSDMEKFNGMQLITKDYKHIATYYKEFLMGKRFGMM